MTKVRGFAPVLGAEPRILILGSMPGIASLEAQQYYAHSRNAFWPIMQALFGIATDWPYARRVKGLEAHGVAQHHALEPAGTAATTGDGSHHLTVDLTPPPNA